MDTNNNNSVKKNIIIMFKELLKFTLLAMIILLIVVSIMTYILLEIYGMNIELVGILSGIISAILILIIDYKKLHIHNKIVECNMRILKRFIG